MGSFGWKLWEGKTTVEQKKKSATCKSEGFEWGMSFSVKPDFEGSKGDGVYGKKKGMRFKVKLKKKKPVPACEVPKEPEPVKVLSEADVLRMEIEKLRKENEDLRKKKRRRSWDPFAQKLDLSEEEFRELFGMDMPSISSFSHG